MRLRLLPLALSLAFGATLPPALAADDPAAAALLNRARLWEGRNRPDLAREALDKLFRIAPGHPDGLAELAILDAQTGQPETARKALAQLRRVQPGHPAIPQVEALLRATGSDRGRLRQARQLARAGKTEAALAAFRGLYPGGPPSGDLAMEYWQLVAETANGWEPARAGLAKLARENPDNLRYRLALADHETVRNPLNRQALQVIVELSKNPAFSREARAAWRRAVMRMDKSPAALPLLEEYLAQESGDTAVKERFQATAQAVEAHRRLLADPAYQAEMAGLALLDGNKIDAAEEKLDQALASRPKDAEAVGGMGMVRLRQGHHAEAQGYFLQALQLDPDNAAKWKSLLHTARFWGLLKEAGDAREAGEFPLAEDKLKEALALDPKEPNAYVALARLQDDRGLEDEAEQSYRRALAFDPVHRGALNGLLAFYLRHERTHDAQGVIAALTPAQRLALGTDLNALEASLLRSEADRLLAAGREDEAMAVLERAVATDPDDPWLRFDLARLYARHGEKPKGRALFDRLLSRHPGDATALYALALYQSGQDEDRGAMATLEHIPARERSANMTRLQRRLWVRAQGQQARRLLQAGQGTAARERLAQAKNAARGDADLAATLAFQWLDLGEAGRGRELLEGIRRSGGQPAPWRLRYAEYLGLQGEEDEQRAELDAIAAQPRLTPEDRTTLAGLRQDAAVRHAEALVRDGNPAAARKILDAALAAHPDAIPLLLGRARTFRAEGRVDEARAAYRRVLVLSPRHGKAREEMSVMLAQAGRRDDALEQIRRWTTRAAPKDTEDRLTLIGLLMELEEYGQAREQTDALLADAPDNGRALAYAGQLARRDGRFDQAIGYLQRSLAAEQREAGGGERLPALSRLNRKADALEVETAPAPADQGSPYRRRQLAELLDQRTPWLSAAVDWRSRTGTAGTSQFDSWEIPVEWRTPWGADDQAYFRADTVKVGAGTLDFGDAAAARSLGSVLLCQPACPTGDASQSAAGVSFTAGYAREDLQADIGTTPLGFPVQNLVGGVRKKGDLGIFSYSLEGSRRPITGSLLSYAGTKDPRTGTVWGGVVATGVRLGLSLDQGGALGFWSSLGFHKLTGRNVQSNDRTQLMAGGYWRVINEEDRLFTVGLTGMAWRFKRNAGEYTFGHGGYYSPQEYRSLSFPISYAQRFTRFSYQVRAAVSSSWSRTDAAPYFPTDGAMQAQAEALTPLNGVDPHYAAGSGPGKGHSFLAAGEYQVTSQLFLGGRLEIERSDYYAPNRLLFYLRYSPDSSAARPVFLPPEPVIPTSQY